MVAKRIVAAASLLLLLVGCQKDELPVEPHEPGPLNTNEVVMGPGYGMQLFYDIGTSTIVSSNHKNAWDIGFESGEDGWHVVLNTARGGAAAIVENVPFQEVSGTDGLQWKNDAPSGNLDSTAFGDYRNTDRVYVIDRGYDTQGNQTGYRKLAMKSVDADSYTIRIAALDNSGDTTVTIAKDDAVNFTSFSFRDNSVVEIEPKKEAWDLLFTQYTHVFQDPPTAYLVTGVLLNRHQVLAAEAHGSDFSAIGSGDFSELNFTSALNVIGYDWKEYSFDSGLYEVYPEMNYLITDHEGRRFKLHFIDFYDDSGQKGTPVFEWQEL